MSLLTVCETVARRNGLAVPTAILSSDDRAFQELGDLAKECAFRLRDAGNWEVLLKEESFTGDGTTLARNMPSDFYRFPKEINLYSSRLDRGLKFIPSQDEWQEIITRNYEYVIGIWTIFGGQYHIRPAVAVDETVSFFYQSKNIWTNGGDEPATDEDTLILPERLLALGMNWEWRKRRGLEYAEDMEDYERALAAAVARDNGPRVIRIGRARPSVGVDYAYPQTIIPQGGV